MDFDQLEMKRIIESILRSDLSSTNDISRPYFLVIFNNRQWSDFFRQQRTEEMERNFRAGLPYSFLEPFETFQQSMLDSQFSQDLRHIVNGSMCQTQRPFPLKYFIDFTEH